MSLEQKTERKKLERLAERGLSNDKLATLELPRRKSFRYSNLFIIAGGLLVIWYSANQTGVSIEPFFDPGNTKQVGKFIAGLFPPDTSESFLLLTWDLTLQTLYISIIGTVLAILLGFPLSLLAMRKRGEEYDRNVVGWRRWSGRVSLYWLSRTVLNLARAVPELIWALIAIIFVGLGPFAGVIALAIHSGGVLGKLYAELFEAVDQRLVEASRSTGANEGQVLLYTRIPVTLPILLSYTIFRWECNMRAATILGFVAAGGLGNQLSISMARYNYHQITTLAIALLILVTLVDIVGQFIRKRVLDVPQSVRCDIDPAELVAQPTKTEV